MKKLVYFALLTIFIFIVSCESPMKIQVNELDNIIGSDFNRSELKDGGDFSVGYYNGNITTSQVALSWGKTTEEDFAFYKLTRDNSELAVFTDISVNSFQDTLVNENSYYNYQITVFAENGMVAKDTIEIKTAQWQPPSNLRVNGLSNTDVQLTWDDNSDSEDYFKIYFYDNFKSLIDSFTVDNNVTEKIVTDLDSTGSYYFEVMAESQWEEGRIQSPQESFDMTDFVFYPPSDLNCSQNSDMSIELNWQDNSTLETGFSIERKINSGSFDEIAEIKEIDLETYTDMDTLAYEIGDTLTYRVRAFNDYENLQYTDYSNECQIVIHEFNGINENFNDGIANNWIDDGSGRWNVVNDKYRMEGNYSSEEALSYYNEVMTDFTYEADITKNYGDYSSGLYFRGDGQISYGEFQNGYLFVIDSDSGSYSVWKSINGDISDLIYWTYSSYVNPMGETNNLKVVCEGSNMSFYINDNLVETILEDTFSSGYVGLWAYDGEADIVDFDNVILDYTVSSNGVFREVTPQRVSKENIYNSEVSK